MSLALTLYDALCVVGNALEAARETFAPASDPWLALTDILGALDEAIDLLVRAAPLDDGDDVNG
jgi:hypothetical protein